MGYYTIFPPVFQPRCAAALSLVSLLSLLLSLKCARARLAVILPRIIERFSEAPESSANTRIELALCAIAAYLGKFWKKLDS